MATAIIIINKLFFCQKLSGAAESTPLPSLLLEGLTGVGTGTGGGGGGTGLGGTGLISGEGGGTGGNGGFGLSGVG